MRKTKYFWGLELLSVGEHPSATCSYSGFTSVLSVVGGIHPSSVIILGLPLEPVLPPVGEHPSFIYSCPGFTSGFNIVMVLLSMQEGYHRSRGSDRWRKHETGRSLSLSEATSSAVGMGEPQGHPYTGKGSDTVLKSQVQFLS